MSKEQEENIKKIFSLLNGPIYSDTTLLVQCTYWTVL